MKKTAKHIAQFAGASMIGGASAMAVAPFGATYGTGISSAASMIPAVGTTMMAGNMVRMTSNMLPKRKRVRRRR